MKRSRIKKKIRKCKICNEDMWEIGIKGAHRICHYNENGFPDKVYQKGKPVSKKQNNRGLRRIDTLNDLDRICSAIVRLRDTDEDGYGLCISTGANIYYLIDDNNSIVTNCDCGHLFNRWKMSVRHNLDNMHAQLRVDNRDQNRDQDVMHQNVKNKIGVSRYNEIKMLSSGLSKMNKLDLARKKARYLTILESLFVSKNWSSKNQSSKKLWDF